MLTKEDRLLKGNSWKIHNPIERFWYYIDKRSDEECWEWLGAKISTGYGHMWIGNGYEYMHRYSYIIHFGNIPDGLHVCHTCDNPSCVNPSHLFLGTAKDNAIDREKKGRRKSPIGNENFKSKLNEVLVVEIRNYYKAGGITKKELAELYKVNVNTIGCIISRKTWKNVN